MSRAPAGKLQGTAQEGPGDEVRDEERKYSIHGRVHVVKDAKNKVRVRTRTPGENGSRRDASTTFRKVGCTT